MSDTEQPTTSEEKAQAAYEAKVAAMTDEERGLGDRTPKWPDWNRLELHRRALWVETIKLRDGEIPT